MNEKYVVILNFESGKVDCISLENRDESMDISEFIEGLDYNLSSCEWMAVEVPIIYPLNF